MQVEKLPFDFHEQLAIGQKGEKFFVKEYPHLLEALDGRAADMRIIGPKNYGHTVELKTETYAATRGHPRCTGNMFVERFSNNRKQTNGGPWQAKANGTNEYWHHFPLDGVLYRALVIPFVDWLDEYVALHKVSLYPVDNERYDTMGYRIPLMAVDKANIAIKRTDPKLIYPL